MAKVNKVPAVTVVQVVQPESFTLELSKEEAGIIQSLLAKCSCTGPTHPIYEILSEAGVVATHRIHDGPMGDIVGTLVLKKR